MIDQKFLELLLDVTNTFIGLYEVQAGCFIKINKYGLAMFQADTFEQVSTSIKQHLSTEDWFHNKPIVFEAQKSRKKEAIFYSHLGVPFWGKLEINALDYENKIYLVVRISNIDHYKSTKQKKIRNEERFKAVFENAAVGIIVTQSSGEILLANQYTQILFGYTTDELIGHQIEILLPEAFRTAHIKHREQYRELHKMRPMGEGMELHAQRKNGHQFPVEVSLSYFHDQEQLFVVAFIQDISSKVHMAQQLLNQKAAIEKMNENLETKVENRTKALLDTLHSLEKSKEELEKALVREKELGELKSRFVSMASHEFRTPLSGILSSATLIGKYKNLEDQQKREKHVGRIQSSVGYLTDILDEFLSIGKLEEGNLQAHFTPVDWIVLMDNIIADMKPILKPGQKIQFFHKGISEVFIDKSLLRKIVINLLSNASKFSAEETSIFVNSASSSTHFSMSVTDQGMGIPDGDQKHLFERFFRGSNSVNIQGTGLGLHIVAKYVELMHGQVSLSSKLNQGTTVTICFPLSSLPSSTNTAETVENKYINS